jgi:hypothetical protein
MDRTKQDYLNLAKETFDYYMENPRRRALIGSQCKYHTDDGKMCAVGRCLIDAKSFENKVFDAVNDGLDSSNIVGLIEYGFDIDNLLKDEYKGFNTEFWTLLQVFHDVTFFWSGSDITDDGKRKMSEINHWVEININ